MTPTWEVRQMWHEEALCAQTDPDLFFPQEKGASAAGAKRVCMACPVRVPCLDEAMQVEAMDAIFGTRGGLSAAERLTLRRRAA